MKFLIVWTFLALILLAATNAEEKKKECGADPEKDGQVTAWFKNAGCTIKKQYDDLSESAKPYTDQVAAKAKEFGHSVAEKYDEVKHKLSDSDEKKTTDSQTAPVVNVPTEKVPLAPLPGDAKATTGEHKTPLVEPEGFDDRFLLQPNSNDCPKGKVLDSMNRCRPAVK